MSDKCIEIIERVTQSLAKSRIVMMLWENPNMMDNLRGLSAWVILPEAVVASELDELVSLGVLRKYGKGPGAVYRFTRDEEARACIGNHRTRIDQAIKELRAREWRGV